MKIAIVSDEHFPYTSADTEVIVNTAAALGKAGAQVSLVIPWIKKRKAEDIFSYYGVPPSFDVISLRGWPFPERTFRIEKILHGVIAPFWKEVAKADVLHTRDLIPLLGAHLRHLPWSFETYRRHSEEKPWLPSLVRHVSLQRGIGAVAHTEASRADLIRIGFPPEGVVVARPGTDLRRFSPSLSQEEARRLCGVIHQGLIVGYAGNIQAFKGIDEVLQVAQLVPEASFLIVGGKGSDLERLRNEVTTRRLKNVILVGHRPAGEVPRWLFCADILLVPSMYKNEMFSRVIRWIAKPTLPGTPFKLYSYMATGRPIVAASQSITTELLTDQKNALLYAPGNAEGAAQAIRFLLQDPGYQSELGKNSKALSAQYTWARRAEIMLEFFEKRLRSWR